MPIRILFLFLEKKQMLVEILDKTIPGETSNSFKIELEQITSPEKIISARVKEEVKNYNNKIFEKQHSLVMPLKKEDDLNNKKTQEVDAEQQIYIALEAFQKNGFFILVDDLQVTELKQKIHLKSNSTISFVKLTQLVGG